MLRVSGDSLDVAALLAAVDMEPDKIWRKGERRSASRPDSRLNVNSGVNFVASDAGLQKFDEQVREATVFLKERARELEVIAGFPGVEAFTLDFGIELRDVFVHSDFLKPDFLRAAADAGVTVELSHYPCAGDEDD
jgi:hypothetical protein